MPTRAAGSAASATARRGPRARAGWGCRRARARPWRSGLFAIQNVFGPHSFRRDNLLDPTGWIPRDGLIWPRAVAARSGPTRRLLYAPIAVTVIWWPLRSPSDSATAGAGATQKRLQPLMCWLASSALLGSLPTRQGRFTPSRGCAGLEGQGRASGCGRARIRGGSGTMARVRIAHVSAKILPTPYVRRRSARCR